MQPKVWEVRIYFTNSIKEQSTITTLLAEMTQEQKDQYTELEATAAALRADAEQSRNQIDHLNREKDEFLKEISGSQVSTLTIKHTKTQRLA